LYHHERWNGSGYPKGLKEKDIPLPARIIAVVDIWDSLISDRPYRRVWSKQKTWRYLQKTAGVELDPDIVKIIGEKFVHLMDAKTISSK